MRTQEAILKRIEELKDSDCFGVDLSDLVNYLNYENAKQFLKEGVAEEEWNKDRKSSDEDVLKEMKGYINFAWEKANDERGLSANRRLGHYSAWIWVNTILKLICMKYNIPDKSD